MFRLKCRRFLRILVVESTRYELENWFAEVIMPVALQTLLPFYGLHCKCEDIAIDLRVN